MNNLPNYPQASVPGSPLPYMPAHLRKQKDSSFSKPGSMGQAQTKGHPQAKSKPVRMRALRVTKFPTRKRKTDPRRVIFF